MTQNESKTAQSANCYDPQACIVNGCPHTQTAEREWDADKDDEWSGVIDAAHPIKTGDYKTYDLARKMVGNRHSKYALIDLVNWLLKVRNVEI